MKKILKDFGEYIGIVLHTVVYGEVKCRIFVLMIIALFIMLFGMAISPIVDDNTNKSNDIPTETNSYVEVSAEVSEVREKIAETTTVELVETTSEPEVSGMSQKDIELIALLTMAEAEGECEEGKRLVIDTVLNRVDSNYWPDTVTGVIYQSNQFSPVWNGRLDRCYVTEEHCQLVKEELNNRTNDEVVFFRTDHYSEYGQPMFQVGNHYFSSYS